MLKALLVWLGECAAKLWPRISAFAASLASLWSAGILAHPVSHLVTATVAAMLTLFARWVLA